MFSEEGAPSQPGETRAQKTLAFIFLKHQGGGHCGMKVEALT